MIRVLYRQVIMRLQWETQILLIPSSPIKSYYNSIPFHKLTPSQQFNNIRPIKLFKGDHELVFKIRISNSRKTRKRISSRKLMENLTNDSETVYGNFFVSSGTVQKYLWDELYEINPEILREVLLSKSKLDLVTKKNIELFFNEASK